MQLTNHRVARTLRRKDERVLWPGACPNLATDAMRSLHGSLQTTVGRHPRAAVIRKTALRCSSFIIGWMRKASSCNWLATVLFTFGVERMKGPCGVWPAQTWQPMRCALINYLWPSLYNFG